MESLGGKRYCLVVVDDFFRYTWVAFLREKSEAFDEFIILCKRMQTKKELIIKRIRSDHGGEFENHKSHVHSYIMLCLQFRSKITYHHISFLHYLS